MKAITFRLPDQELEILQAYCQQEGRNQTDVLREYIRTLKKKVKHDKQR
jgi:predicted DNA-binding protein